MINRRGFIGRVAGALAAAPLAAQEAAGLSAGPSLGLSGYSGGIAEGATETPKLPGRGLTKAQMIAKVLGDKSLRALLEEQAREENGPPGVLDPDLAANRSFSLSAKMQIQRERNIKRWLDRALDPQERVWCRLRNMGISL